jgi:AcrR family transcriptional regulator
VTNPPPTAKPERADSRRKRLRLIKAAVDALAEHGLEVAGDDIADRAEVGIGTLYRRFGSKEALIEAAVAEISARYVRELRAALMIDDAAERLKRFLRVTAEVQIANRGFVEFTAVDRTVISVALRDDIQAIRAAFTELTERSQRDGVLRGDITWRDLVIVARAAVATTPALGIRADDGQWQRTLAVLLDGLRPPGTEPLPGQPPSDTDPQTRQAMSADQ